MLITKYSKLSDVILSNYNAVPVIMRFGINFGFGDKSILEISKEYGIDPDFIAEILNVFLDADYSPDKHLSKFSVKTIVSYLKKSHKDYITSKIPHIEDLIKALRWQDKALNKNSNLLLKFFTQYRDEVFEHMDYEEENVYPYSEKLEETLLNKKNISIQKFEKYTIKVYAEIHDDIEEKLLDLKNILIKYLPPVENQDVLHHILFDLFRLEKDLNNHSRIEEKVLIPKVKLIEEELKLTIK